MARTFSGRRLREEREAAGLSVEHVAIAIERTSYSVHEYEWGRVQPTVPTLGILADLFEIPVDALFEEVAHVA